MRVRKRLSIPLVAGIALVAVALFEAPPQLLQEVPAKDASAEAPDSYAFTVSVRNFGEEGVLLDRTDASYLKRFEKSAITELESPRRWGHEGNGDWVASAAHGRLIERNDTMFLTGDVRLIYTSEEVEFGTEAMRFNLKKRTALSEAPVRVWRGPNETYADQLYAILDWKQARLTGNVRTVYVP